MNGRLHQHALKVDLDLQLTHRSQKSSSKESNYRSKMGCESEDMQGKTEEEIEMMKLMGFGAFDSTKGKKKEGSDAAFAFNVSQKRKYRSVYLLFY
uniref:U4/U6.U5 small nuclear ribonucleoprotein 27 kDa protein n=1 Tax=Cyprinus carpio TaxID=7962 RepID=A0A8C2HLR1_CYPCA